MNLIERYPFIKLVFALIAGLFIGNFINIAIILIGSQVIPLPAGVDPKNMESIKNNLHLFQVQHFISPFLAHALGTLTASLLAASTASLRPIASTERK